MSDLHLQGNRLEGALPLTLSRCVSLVRLDLGGNAFAGPLPTAFWALDALQELRAPGNDFCGEIPGIAAKGPGGGSGVGHLRQLRVLDLAQNQLEGPVPGAALARCVSLEELDLGGNRLTGRVPGALGSLRKVCSRAAAAKP